MSGILADLDRTEEIVDDLGSNPEVDHVTVVTSFDDEELYLKVWLYGTTKPILPIMQEYDLSVGMAAIDTKDDREVLMVTLGHGELAEDPGPHVGVDRVENHAHGDWRAWYDVTLPGDDRDHISFTYLADSIPEALEGLAEKIRGERI